MAGLVPAVHVFTSSIKKDVTAWHVGVQRTPSLPDGYGRA